MISSVGAALLAVGTASGCGQLPGTPAQPRPEAELVDAVTCTTMQHIVEPETPSGAPSAPPPPAVGAVPAGFVPVGVIRCSAVTETLEDEEGLWSAVTQERLSGDIHALVDALAQPSDGPRMNQACTADMELVPDLWLLDAEGQAMRAAWPTDSCGKTKPGVREVLAGMEVVDSRQYKVALIQPRAALDAGCPAKWSIKKWSINALPGTVQLAPLTMDPLTTDSLTLDPDGADRSGSGETLPAAPVLPPNTGEVDTLRICHYRATPTPTQTPTPTGADGQPGDAQPASPFDAVEITGGTFSGGGTLEGQVKDALLQAAADDVPAAECTGTATEFAALWPLARGEAAGPPLTVELDACRRLLGFDGAARTVPDELITAVAAALHD